MSQLLYLGDKTKSATSNDFEIALFKFDIPKFLITQGFCFPFHYEARSSNSAQASSLVIPYI